MKHTNLFKEIEQHEGDLSPAMRTFLTIFGIMFIFALPFIIADAYAFLSRFF